MSEAKGRGNGPWAWSDGRAQLYIGGNRRARCGPAPALVRSDGSRPWQLFHAARAHQHARRVVAASPRVLQQKFHGHDHAVGRQARGKKDVELYGRN